MSAPSGAASRGSWSAWQAVIGFGAVSLAVDLVADGARSITGPLLGELGASALIVGLVTGTAEALGFMLRLASGPLADRSRRYWGFAIAGYSLTAISVPLLAVTPFLGTAGLTVAAALIIIERTGKAVRSPAKTVLLASVASAVGRGRGFGVHKLLDQIGAFSGPLVVAAIIAATGMIWPAFAFLVVPAIAAMVLLVWMRRRVPDPSLFEIDVPAAAVAPSPTPPPLDSVPTETAAAPAHRRVPTTFVLFAVSTGLTAFGLIGFGLISFHLTTSNIVPLAAAPLVFSLGMAAAAVAAVVSGRLYDVVGPAVLLGVPVLAAGVPLLVFSDAVGGALIGIVLWGAATGIQDSTVKALVADLVAPGRRGTAYGVFAVFQGAGTFAGAVVAGALYPDAGAIAGIVVSMQVIAIVVLAVVVLRSRGARGARR